MSDDCDHMAKKLHAIPTNMSDSCLLETRKNLQATTHNVANHTSHFLSLNSLNCLQRVPLKNGLF